MTATDKLTHAEAERLAEFLLHHMDMDTRLKLIAEMPVTYARLYPEVAPEVITEVVAKRIRQDRQA